MKTFDSEVFTPYPGTSPVQNLSYLSIFDVSCPKNATDKYKSMAMRTGMRRSVHD